MKFRLVKGQLISEDAQGNTRMRLKKNGLFIERDLRLTIFQEDGVATKKVPIPIFGIWSEGEGHVAMVSQETPTPEANERGDVKKADD